MEKLLAVLKIHKKYIKNKFKYQQKKDNVTINFTGEKMSKRHATIGFKEPTFTITDLQSESGTWKKIVSYYGEPVYNTIYRIGDTTFTCYKGSDIEFLDEWLHKHGLLRLWGILHSYKINNLEKLRIAVSKKFEGIKFDSENDKADLLQASKNFDQDYYEGCTKYRIIIQFIEGPMKGIETEIGIRGITFGSENTEVDVFNEQNNEIKGYAKITYQNGHYFLMNSRTAKELCFFKCIFKSFFENPL